MPEGSKPRPVQSLANRDPAGWVAALDSPNGWQRDTAQRLLVERQAPSSGPLLRKLFAKTARAQSRVQILCTLAGLNAVQSGDLTVALQDPAPAVREHAIRLSEPLLAQLDPANPNLPAESDPRGKWLRALLERRDDPEVKVRFQLALTLGEWRADQAGEALAALAVRDGALPEMRTAILSSATRHLRVMMPIVLRNERNAETGMTEELVALASSMNEGPSLAGVFRDLARKQDGHYASWQFNSAAGVVEAMERRGSSWAALRADNGSGLDARQLDPVFGEARQEAVNPAVPEDRRLAAIRLLGHSGNDQEQEQDAGSLARLLLPQQPVGVQRAAMKNLAKSTRETVPGKLIEEWPMLTPTLRTEVLQALMSRPTWVQVLLQAVQNGQIPTGQLGTAIQAKLLDHPQSAIRDRARALLTLTNPDRQKVLKAYAGVAEKTGDPARGAALFVQNCATCHRFREQGVGLGPDLATLTDRSPSALLLAIIDPNRAVEATYVSYQAVAADGRELSGIMVEETANSITLRAAGGTEEVLLRSNLKSLTSSGLSLMPEGLEQALDLQAMADLMAYLTQ